MQKKKVWLSLLMIATLFVLLVSKPQETQASSGTTGDCTWTLEDGVLTISGEGEMGDYTPYYGSSGLAPWGTNIREVIVEDGVTSIGRYAFYECSNLESIELPDGLTSIGADAFYGCSSLENIELPDGLTSIGVEAFEYCSSLESIELPDGLTSIGETAFQNCSSLKSIELPDGLTSIGAYTFYGCSSLESIDLPDGLTNIGAGAIKYCSNLASIELPDSLTSIGASTFSGCSNLASIDLPDGLTNMGEGAFEYCSSLESIELPDGLISIGERTFYGCSSLKSIELPDGLISIGEYAFCDCSSLESIELPDGLTSIECNAFSYCSSLKSIDLPESVTSIAYRTFQVCSSLESINLPDGLTSIGDYAFADCSRLEKIIIPRETVEIGECVFERTNSVVIYGYSGSCAETYAKANNKQFIALDNEEEPEITNPFVDIWEGAYYYQPVLWAYANGITAGINATEFGPETTCTRGQIVTFLWRALGKPSSTLTSNPFVDVPSGIYYEEAVLWAYENGITSGVSATEFGPEETCTRAQIVTFLWRAFGRPEAEGNVNPFVDVPENMYYTEAVLWAVENGITSGISETEFGPEASCTRGQVVSFLYRAYKE